MRLASLSLIPLLTVASALAQETHPAQGTSPFNATASFNENYDNSSGYSSELDGDVGMGFGNHFSLHTGAPFYLFQETQVAGSTTTSRVSGVGDAYVKLAFENKGDLLHYTSTLVGTLPSGDSSLGMSTGRASGGWVNRFSHDFGAIEPFGEVGIGTGSAALAAYLLGTKGRSQQLPFSSLGVQSVWRGGLGVPLGNKVDLEAGVYDILPFGNQKLYSKEIKSGSVGVSSGSQKGQHGRTWELAHVVSGDAGIAADHGLMTDLNVSPSRHFEFDASFGRSLHYAVNTLSFTVSVHFGGGSTPRAK